MAFKYFYGLTVSALLATAHTGLAEDSYYDLEPILYSDTEPDNIITRLEEALRSGTRTIDHQNPKSFLLQLLDHLDVPAESQVLVFSKTSKQRSLISPSNPRAIYFSDECYIGWMPGGQIEITCYGPELGPVFYIVDSQKNTSPPQFIRDNSCLSCHTRHNARGNPGVLVRSVFTDRAGEPILHAGTFLTTHESPFEERWGGWYVTGSHGEGRHMGNTAAVETERGASLDRESGANLQSLKTVINTDRYLQPTSDIVALMVLEHQTMIHNTLTEASFRTRTAKYRYNAIREALDEPETEELSGSALLVANSQAEKILRALLFYKEAALPDGGIEGSDAFETAFREDRKETGKGQSLKDFQLLTRLFKNRCSYMIYSGAFTALPEELKTIVYLRLWKILRGDDPDGEYAHLGHSEKKRIYNILRETVEDLPSYWVSL